MRWTLRTSRLVAVKTPGRDFARGQVRRGRVLAVLVAALAVWGPAALAVGCAAATEAGAGSKGTASEVPRQALNTGGGARVNSVSCATAGSCAAGGHYADSRGQQGFVAVETNGVWGKASELPGLGALNTGGAAEVTSVSCGSAGSCAVGGYYTGRRGRQGFVAVATNGVWGRAVEVPGLAALNTGGSAVVGSVSCGSAGSCAAGGVYKDRRDHGQGFVAVETNGVWGTAIEVPGLGALDTAANVFSSAAVSQVSCGSAGSCAAGGYYTDRHGEQGFVAVETNGVWGKASELPGLAALDLGAGAEVTSVSCGSAGSCAAGGEFSNQHGGQGFVAVETNGVWGRAVEVPGLGALNTRGVASVVSVSCAPVGSCAAGGFYSDRHDVYMGFVAVERDGVWGTAMELPGLATLSRIDDVSEATVLSLSCDSAASCAVGGYYLNHHGYQGFVAVERNGHWGTAVEVPGLAALNNGGSAKVYSVSCTPAGSCAVGGVYSSAVLTYQGFVTVERDGVWGRPYAIGLGQ